MERGTVPPDMELAGRVVRKVCHENVRDYFGFERTSA
jgi:hypothetical protein